MIDWLSKLPEPLIGITLAGAAWFGFNYAVLGERAMAKAAEVDVMPSCVHALVNYESSLDLPRIGLGSLFGVPQLDTIEDLARQLYKPRYLSQAEKLARCECAVLKSKSSSRFDYAIYTASFRIIAPESVGTLRDRSTDLVFSGACGALPRPPGG
jgi:hypothetical protein